MDWPLTAFAKKTLKQQTDKKEKLPFLRRFCERS
jgi:hypothetical protein